MYFLLLLVVSCSVYRVNSQLFYVTSSGMWKFTFSRWCACMHLVDASLPCVKFLDEFTYACTHLFSIIRS